MVSIIEEQTNKDQEFLRRNRIAYLRTVGAEMGMPSDLRNIALREARAMIEFAEDLLAPRVYRRTPAHNSAVDESRQR